MCAGCCAGKKIPRKSALLGTHNTERKKYGLVLQKPGWAADQLIGRDKIPGETPGARGLKTPRARGQGSRSAANCCLRRASRLRRASSVGAGLGADSSRGTGSACNGPVILAPASAGCSVRCQVKPKENNGVLKLNERVVSTCGGCAWARGNSRSMGPLA